MVVHDKNPIIKWEQGQGDISNVRIAIFFFLDFRHSHSSSKSGRPDTNV